MAVYHLKVSMGSRSGGQSARAKADYIERAGRYEQDQDDELAHREIGEHAGVGRKMTGAPIGKRRTSMSGSTGRLFREVEFALAQGVERGRSPVELASGVRRQVD